MIFSKYLRESLDTPAEFYMTDDTIMPDRISAIIEIDDRKYHVSLDRSNAKGLYILNFGLLMSKKVKYWKINKSSDMRPVMGAVLKFVEASYPFLKSHLSGIAIRLPAKAKRNYLPLLGRIAKKTYAGKFFKILPVDNTIVDNGYQFLFLSRLGANVDKIFKYHAFKEYEISKRLTADEIESVELKKKERTVKSERPSRRYSFNNLDVEISAENFDEIESKKEKIKILDEVTNAEKTYKVDTKKIKDIDSNGASYGFMDKIFIKAINEVGDKNKIELIVKELKKKKYSDIVEKSTSLSKDAKEDFSFRLSIMNKSIVMDKIRELERKYNIHIDKSDFFEYILNNIAINETSLITFRLVDKINKDKFIDKDYIENKKFTYEELIGNDEFSERIKENSTYLKDAKIFNVWNASHVTTLIKNYINSRKPRKIYEEKIKGLEYDFSNSGFQNLTNDLIDDLPVGTGSNHAYSISVNDHIKFLEDNGYGEEFFTKTLSKDEYIALRSYTGSSYGNYNKFLRDSVGNDTWGSSPLKNEVLDMMNSFNKVQPLPEDMVVYRTSSSSPVLSNWDINQDYVEPGFLSTTIDPYMQFSSNSSYHLTIIIPKGSKVIPILDYSKNSAEREVILPPMSVLKPIKVEVFDIKGIPRTYIQFIYVGNAMNSFMKNNILNEEQVLMVEDNKENAETTGKFTGSFVSIETMKKILKDIKSGILKKES